MGDDMLNAVERVAWPRPVTSPVRSPESRVFWEGCDAGKFLFKRCLACGEPHFYPRSACPFCFSDRVEWEEASGKGTLYSFTIVRRSPTGPYALAYVELEEGPRLMTNIVRCDFEALRVGQPVALVVADTLENATAAATGEGNLR